MARTPIGTLDKEDGHERGSETCGDIYMYDVGEYIKGPGATGGDKPFKKESGILTTENKITKGVTVSIQGTYGPISATVTASVLSETTKKFTTSWEVNVYKWTQKYYPELVDQGDNPRSQCGEEKTVGI